MSALARLRTVLWVVALCLLLGRSSWATITTIGDVTPDPHYTTSEDDLYIANTANGMMLVDADSDVVAGESYVGLGAGATGFVTIDGAGSTWTNSGNLSVGDYGTGILNITGGGLVSDEQASLGRKPLSVGMAMVDGPGSTWINSGSLSLGAQGTARLTITGGGQVINAWWASLGSAAGSTGSVTVDGADSSWDSLGDLMVGYRGTGIISITGGGTVTSRSGSLGEMPGSTGMAIVNGAGSKWSASELRVGYGGTGTLAVTGGGQVVVVGNNFEGGAFSLGVGPGGEAMVDGPGSTLSSQTVDVAGSLSVTGGGLATDDYGEVSWVSGSAGTVTVDGPGSTWANKMEVTVGRYGAGTVNVTNGAVVNSGRFTYLGYHEGASGQVNVDGFGSTWNGGELHVGEGGDGSVSVTGGGRLSSSIMYIGYAGSGSLHIAGGGQVVNISRGFARLGFQAGSTGAVTIDGPSSSWTVSSTLHIGEHGSGSLRIMGGTVEVGNELYLAYYGPSADFPASAGSLELAGGVLRMRGGVLRRGKGTAAFDFTGGRLEGVRTIDLGTPLVQKGGTLAPGNSVGTTMIQGGYTLDRGALEIGINLVDAPGFFASDVLDVNGAVDLVGGNGLLDGTLNVMLGADVRLGDEFVVVDNDGADPIIGMFVTGPFVRSPFGDDLYRFLIDYTAGDGNDISLLTQSVGLWGDYNGDGTVDALDYTVWQDALGDRVAPYFGADGNGDGTVNAPDFDVWKAHFGGTAGGMAATGSASVAVPEPGSFAPLVLGALAIIAVRRR